jgi:hypothetical protein
VQSGVLVNTLAFRIYTDDMGTDNSSILPERTGPPRKGEVQEPHVLRSLHAAEVRLQRDARTFRTFTLRLVKASNFWIIRRRVGDDRGHDGEDGGRN